MTLDEITKNVLSWHVWKPQSVCFHAAFEHCRQSVYDQGAYRSRQCTRKPKETIGGYGFCRQHAKKVHETIEQQVKRRDRCRPRC